METTQELEQLLTLDIEQITSINMTSIGLLDTFGRLDMKITMKDDTIKDFEFISPVPTGTIIDWLKRNNLLDLATLYKF